MAVCSTCKQVVKKKRPPKPKPQPLFRHRGAYSSWITRSKKVLDYTGLAYEKAMMEKCYPLFLEARNVFDTGDVDKAIEILRQARSLFWRGQSYWYTTSWVERNDSKTWLPGRQPSYRF